jgi:hypothetical protein
LAIGRRLIVTVGSGRVGLAGRWVVGVVSDRCGVLIGPTMFSRESCSALVYIHIHFP